MRLFKSEIIEREDKTYHYFNGTLIICILTVLTIVLTAWEVTTSCSFWAKYNPEIQWIEHTGNLETVKLHFDNLIQYAKEDGLTKGATSILWYSSTEDLGLWYQNLLRTNTQLQTANETMSPLEKSNYFYLLERTINWQPSGISLYPYNVAWCIVTWSILFFVVTVIILLCIISSQWESNDWIVYRKTSNSIAGAAV